MIHLLKITFIALALWACASTSQAVDLYSLYTKQCARTNGAIIDVGEEQVTVLEFDGQTKTIDIASVKAIAKYRVVGNPFERFIHKSKSKYLFWVLEKGAAEKFRAYPVNFFDNLIFFLDTEGNLRVIEKNRIVSLERILTDEKDQIFNLSKSKSVYLEHPSSMSECRDVYKNQQLIVSNQLINDKLKLSSFWEKMRSGYREVESLRERTLFYPRPTLYDDKSRLGILYQGQGFDDYAPTYAAESQIPIYIEFGGGDPYRFQSHTTFGGKDYRMVPTLLTQDGVKSEFKSHLIHGIFWANLSGFTAGKSIFDDRFDSRSLYMKKASTKPWVLQTMNHMTLLGADYLQFSLSYGYYFPVIGFGSGSEFREYTAKDAAPVFRFGYTLPTWMFEFYLFSFSHGRDFEKPLDEIDYDKFDDDSYYVMSSQFIPSAYDVSSRTLRFNVMYDGIRNLKARSSLLLSTTTIKEDYITHDGQFDTIPVTSTGSGKATYFQNRLSLRMGLHYDYGQWVGLGGEYVIDQVNTKFDWVVDGEKTSRKDNGQLSSYQVKFELIL